MTFKEIAARITGLSIPVFGVSWSPPEPEIAVARRVLVFLEDRRVLFNPYHLEVAHECVDSVIDIRRLLTEEIGRLSSESPLAHHLRAIRAGCRKFLDAAAPSPRRGGRSWGGPLGSEFFTALGELRSTVGLHVAALAVMHGLAVEGELAEVLPERDVESDSSGPSRSKRGKR